MVGVAREALAIRHRRKRISPFIKATHRRHDAATPTLLQLNNGRTMPTVGLGTWKSDPGAVKAAVISAIESGYRHIDCAAGYGNEHEVGAALEDVIARGIVKREDVFITVSRG